MYMYILVVFIRDMNFIMYKYMYTLKEEIVTANIFRMEEDMQAAPSDAVSRAPVPVPVSESDPVSQHGMGTVQQQVADTEQDSEMMGEGDGEEVVSVHVESSESLQPTTSQSGPELVIPVSVLAGAGQEVMEGGEAVEVRAADERPEHLQQPAEQAPKPVEQVVHVHVYDCDDSCFTSGFQNRFLWWYQSSNSSRRCQSWSDRFLKSPSHRQGQGSNRPHWNKPTPHRGRGRSLRLPWRPITRPWIPGSLWKQNSKRKRRRRRMRKKMVLQSRRERKVWSVYSNRYT